MVRQKITTLKSVLILAIGLTANNGIVSGAGVVWSSGGVSAFEGGGTASAATASDDEANRQYSDVQLTTREGAMYGSGAYAFVDPNATFSIAGNSMMTAALIRPENGEVPLISPLFQVGMADPGGAIKLITVTHQNCGANCGSSKGRIRPGEAGPVVASAIVGGAILLVFATSIFSLRFSRTAKGPLPQ